MSVLANITGDPWENCLEWRTQVINCSLFNFTHKYTLIYVIHKHTCLLSKKTRSVRPVWTAEIFCDEGDKRILCESICTASFHLSVNIVIGYKGHAGVPGARPAKLTWFFTHISYHYNGAITKKIAKKHSPKKSKQSLWVKYHLLFFFRFNKKALPNNL